MIPGLSAGLLAVAVAVQAAASPAAATPVASGAGQAVRTAPPDRFPATAEEVIARVDAFEALVVDMQVRFVQTTVLKATAESSEMAGELTMMKNPERFMVRFTKPVEQTVVFDGKSLVLYYPETGQAFRQAASHDEVARLIGVNPAAPVRSFGNGSRARLVGCGGEGCRLAFEGGPPGINWKILVSATEWNLIDAEFENEEMGIVVRCSDYRVNRGLDTGRFRVKLPPGTEIFDGIPGFAPQKEMPGGSPSDGPRGGPKTKDKGVKGKSRSGVASGDRRQAK